MPQVVTGTIASDMYVWDVGTLSWIKWDGTATVTGAAGGTSAVDGDAFTAGASAGTPAMAERDDGATTIANGKIGVLRETAYRALHVNLRDSSGNEVSAGAGTQYTEDAASAADPVGPQLISRRRDSLASEVSTDGDVIAVNSTAKGELYVKHVDALTVSSHAVTNAGTFAVQEATLDAALIAQEATTSGVKGLTVFGAVTTNAPSYTTGKSDALSLDPTGLLRVSLKDTPANTTALKVDGSAVTQPVSGTFWQATQPISGTVTVNALPAGANTIGSVSQNGTWTVQPGNTANTTAWKVDGSAVTQPVSGTVTTTPPANASTNVAQINGVTPLMGAGNTGTGSPRVTISTDQAALPTWGHGATGASVPANAGYHGALAQTALPTAVSAGQLAGILADIYGRLVVQLGTVRDLRGTQATTISNTTETTIVSAIASTKCDLVLLLISNISASATYVDIRDATAGTIIIPKVYCPAGQVVGLQLAGSPVPQTTANNNWTAQANASVTSLNFFVLYDKNK